MDVLTFSLGPQSVQETALVLEAFLEALTVANEQCYRRYPAGPCCPGCARIRYEAPSGPQRFRSVECMYAEGKGACGDLAAMVAGRRRAKGESCRVRVVVVDEGAREFHAVVELGDGTIVDPTAELEAEAAEADEDQGAAEPAAPTCACGV